MYWTKEKKHIRVLVASGGEGPEREVSLASGKAVTEGLCRGGYQARQVILEKGRDILHALENPEKTLVFVALHGSWGENGMFQAFLDMHGIPYTGSGPEGSMKSMEKGLTKLLFAQRKIPTPLWCEIEQARREKVDSLFEEFGASSLVVKPHGCGSTAGISVVHSQEELEEAVDLAHRYDSLVLAEEFIPGRELTVGVWDEEGAARAMPIVEICPSSGFYDYDAKYLRGSTEYIVPAVLSEELTRTIEAYAVEAHRAVGAQVYSRSDVRLSPQGIPYFLEVNTAPGMTDTSLVPKAAAAMGWGFAELVCRIVEISWKLRGKD